MSDTRFPELNPRLSPEEARLIIKAIEEVEREEADQAARDRYEREQELGGPQPTRRAS